MRVRKVACWNWIRNEYRERKRERERERDGNQKRLRKKEQRIVVMVTSHCLVRAGDIDVLEPILLSYKKYHLEQQVQTNDIAYLGES